MSKGLKRYEVHHGHNVLVIEILNSRICLGFGILNLEFPQF